MASTNNEKILYKVYLITAIVLAIVLIIYYTTPWIKDLSTYYKETKGEVTNHVPVLRGVPTTIEEGYPSLKNVDKALKSLVLGNIAFNAPEEIQWNNTAVIELLLSTSFSVDELKDKIQEAGEREGAKIRVADQMSAVLESSGFEIKN